MYRLHECDNQGITAIRWVCNNGDCIYEKFNMVKVAEAIVEANSIILK